MPTEPTRIGQVSPVGGGATYPFWTRGRTTMTFEEILTQVLTLLQREKRLSYRALKVRFGLDDEHLAALRDEIIEAKQLAADDRGLVLVWTGDGAPAPPATASTPARASLATM